MYADVSEEVKHARDAGLKYFSLLKYFFCLYSEVNRNQPTARVFPEHICTVAYEKQNLFFYPTYTRDVKGHLSKVRYSAARERYAHFSVRAIFGAVFTEIFILYTSYTYCSPRRKS